MVSDNILHRRFQKEILPDVIGHRQKEFTFGTESPQKRPINSILTNSSFQFCHWRRRAKDFDLDNNLSLAFLRRHRFFGSKVCVSPGAFVQDVKRIICDDPAIPNQRILDLLMIEVLSHRVSNSLPMLDDARVYQSLAICSKQH